MGPCPVPSTFQYSSMPPHCLKESRLHFSHLLHSQPVLSVDCHLCQSSQNPLQATSCVPMPCSFHLRPATALIPVCLHFYGPLYFLRLLRTAQDPGGGAAWPWSQWLSSREFRDWCCCLMATWGFLPPPGNNPGGHHPPPISQRGKAAHTLPSILSF